MANKIFINLPVKDLDKSVGFFTKLGFKFNPQFTDQNAAAMIVGENVFAMLLVDSFFKNFTPKEISDAKKSTEVLLALTVESRAKVDEMMDVGVAAGGSEAREPQDHGWMYGRSLEDIDGHIWEIFYMDMDAMPAEMKAKKKD